MKVVYKNDGSSGPSYSNLSVDSTWYNGEKIEFESKDKDGDRVDVVLNRKQIKDLRDRLTKFLGEAEDVQDELITVIEE